ncbi:MAG: hypothetical protein EA359_04900 [Balneolaceae bacterium]|nr:MAG: hypothetical protein EA359_04900 [Balneolaceae bacterium]
MMDYKTGKKYPKLKKLLNRFEKNNYSGILFTFAFSLFTFTLFIACDEPFQPLLENNSAPFSIYGYLDATADTQWVRVTLPENFPTPKL